MTEQQEQFSILPLDKKPEGDISVASETSAEVVALTEVKATQKTAKKNTPKKKEKTGSGLGSMLKGARQAKKLSTAKAAEALNMRETFIVAIEAEDFTNMPGGSYVRGFVRSYAQLLEVDVETAVRLLKACNIDKTEEAQTAPPAPIDTRVVPSKQLLVIVVAVLAVLGIVWSLYWSKIRPEAQIATPQPVAETEAGAGVAEIPVPQTAEPAQAAAETVPAKTAEPAPVKAPAGIEEQSAIRPAPSLPEGSN